MRMKDMLVNIYAEQTGQPHQKIINDIDRDNIMTAEQSVAYGLADQVITKR
jgi:ATP-dependent Clp protease protease subunit